MHTIVTNQTERSEINKNRISQRWRVFEDRYYFVNMFILIREKNISGSFTPYNLGPNINF
jgi:hypothetical protein